MERDDHEHASHAGAHDDHQADPMNNSNNMNPFMLDYTTTLPLIDNPFHSSSSDPLLLPQPCLPLMPHNYVDNNSINLESSNVDWVSLLSGFMNNGEGSAMGDHESSSSRRHNGMNGKGMKSRGKKVTPSRVAFHTRSSEDILDDGYKWRKYGQKSVKNSHHPRSYYRCTHHTCNVKKQIQRLSKDNTIVVTTYEGIHNHPCEKLMETLTPLLKQLQFLSRF
ncbi:probable WRKY transcription factor 24 [Cynara cardunculus var. scolymus]|uniref:probable WRKY transcription factor 24 n=1 Tax=Cynara cardunculus var. scolymus TaxID=59895 RepID=UPI000D62F8C6|nr:probable WRKY transcription factor 24 [Cynara cardunculus var. scolymus]